MANDEQNKLAKYIKEFKTKTKPQNNSNLKEAKEDVVNSAMTLPKGREMVFKSGISSKFKESEQSEQSNDDVKYNSFGYDKHKLSSKWKDVLLENISSDLNETDNTDNKLFTPIKKGINLKYYLLNKCFKDH